MGGGNKMTILAAGTYIHGDLFSDDLMIIEGGVEGNVVGNRVIVKSQGWVHGELTCKSLSIELGGVVNGMVRVSSTQNLLGAMHLTQLPPEDDQRALPAAEFSEE
ncbi:protein of unknown function DUF583 [Desulfarculus baarsii DSM 2075]|uniref:Polymer-forming cytoskeletal protein n=2 Tax=Desulfarculus baarsii TaxID=453230 RepID=E1QI31_DESB2|nr:protein of unknown function DUF583 [Desulfarculus baarsii DSM 2075]